MIQNINPVDFSPFGTILAEIRESDGRGEPLRILQGSAPLYRAGADTKVCNRQGLCVLSVSPDGRTFRSFSLGRPVALKEGMYFAVSTVSGAATALLFGKYTSAGIYDGSEQMLLRPKFRMESIYTFFYQEKEAGFVFPGEAHPMLELTYLDRGSLHSVADGCHTVLKQGDILLYGPNQWHMQYADEGVAPRFVTVTFEASGADFGPLYSHPMRLKEAKELLREALDAQAGGDEDMIFSILSLLLLRLLRADGAGQGKTAEPATNENRIVGASQKYIADHVREKLSVPIVAKQVQVSPGYLSALYQKHLQISPGEYIRRVKLQECKQLIREGNLNFTQIASMMEYSTVHHFSRQFKEKFGITPTEYARSIR